MSRKSDLDRRIQRLERQLEALQPAEPVPVHVRGMDGAIVPPLSEDERTGKRPCIIAQTVDGRDPNRKHKKV